MSEGEIYYLQETEKEIVVKRLEITNYNIPQLDRIENKLDSILEKINEKERLKMNKKYKPVRANDVYVSPAEEGEVRVTKGSTFENEEKIKELEDKISALEQTITSLITKISDAEEKIAL